MTQWSEELALDHSQDLVRMSLSVTLATCDKACQLAEDWCGLPGKKY